MSRRRFLFGSLTIAIVAWHAGLRAECVTIPIKSGKRPKDAKPAKPEQTLIDPIKITGAFCGRVVMFANVGDVKEHDSGEQDLDLLDADHGDAVVGKVHVGTNSEFEASGLRAGRYRLGSFYPGRFGPWRLFKTATNAVQIKGADGGSCEQPVLVKLALVLMEE
jgi:hypothetical protein